MRVPEFLKAKQVLPLVNLVSVPRGYILDRWLPFQDTPTDEVLFHQAFDENPMAPFVAVDAEIPRDQNELLQQVAAEVAYIRVKHEFKESDFRWFQEGEGQGTGTIARLQADARRRMGEKVVDLRSMVDARLEWLRANALQGSIAYSSADVNFTLSFGVPTGNQITATPLWNVASADVVGDLNDAVKQVEDVSGVTPTNLLISRQRALDLTKNDGLRAMWREIFGSGGGTAFTLANGMVQEIIRNFMGVNMIVYNARTTSRTYTGADGTTISINQNKLLADNKALLLPDGAVGSTLTSPVPPNLGNGTGLYAWDYTAEKLPYVHEVGIGINAMPIINDANQLCILTI